MDKDLVFNYHHDKLDLMDESLRLQIRQIIKDQKITVAVLDDDPTGTQTVHDVPVLTTWNEEDIHDQLKEGVPLFFILTNSRGCSEAKAREINLTIGKHLQSGAAKAQRKVIVISRSDSTLRGHYPLEVDALQSSLGYSQCLKILAMTFIEGGRFTIDDVHYILQEGKLIPVSETAFARDKTFGYQNANLKEYVLEKTNGDLSVEEVQTLSLQSIKNNSVIHLSGIIDKLKPEATCIVNAVTYQDLQKFALALLHSKQQFIIRSAASIIPAIAGMVKKPLLKAEEMKLTDKNGSLIIVGSHVPLSSSQLEHLMKNEPGCHYLEFEVKRIIEQESDKYIDLLTARVNEIIASKKNVVLYTSRELVAVNDKFQNLAISKRVSENLIRVVQNLDVRPACIVAKGGITSSDIATEGLSAKKVVVLGQILPGVPVWQMGDGSKFPGMPYVVFPGNVGEVVSLTKVYRLINENYYRPTKS